MSRVTTAVAIRDCADPIGTAREFAPCHVEALTQGRIADFSDLRRDIFLRRVCDRNRECPVDGADADELVEYAIRLRELGGRARVL